MLVITSIEPLERVAIDVANGIDGRVKVELEYPIVVSSGEQNKHSR